MSLWDDFDCEMHPVALDTDTVDRLLAGAIAPADAPPGYAEVARSLQAASAEPSSEELARETETVGIVAAAVRSSLEARSQSPRWSFVPLALSRPRLTAALVAAALACSASLASAGALPGAAQDVASSMLAKVGISVPGANESAGTHPERGTSSTITHATPDSTAGKGGEISELARTTELTGVDKGAAVSSAASNGKSHAGQNSSTSEGAGAVDTPNSGGTGTADTASDGQSSKGTSKANSASDGHSSAGSGNASNGQDKAESASGGHSSAGSGNRP
jgi:hypothetical protein